MAGFSTTALDVEAFAEVASFAAAAFATDDDLAAPAFLVVASFAAAVFAVIFFGGVSFFVWETDTFGDAVFLVSFTSLGSAWLIGCQQPTLQLTSQDAHLRQRIGLELVPRALSIVFVQDPTSHQHVSIDLRLHNLQGHPPRCRQSTQLPADPTITVVLASWTAEQELEALRNMLCALL